MVNACRSRGYAELSRSAGVVDLAPQAWERVTASRAIVERQIAAAPTIYGTNTGIGSQKDVEVGDEDLCGLQQSDDRERGVRFSRSADSRSRSAAPRWWS